MARASKKQAKIIMRIIRQAVIIVVVIEISRPPQLFQRGLARVALSRVRNEFCDLVIEKLKFAVVLPVCVLHGGKLAGAGGFVNIFFFYHGRNA